MNSQTKVIEEGNLISCKMKLLTLTPVFVGGGEDSHLGRTRYILETGKNGNRIHFLDEKKWANFIAGNNPKKKILFEDYLEFIKRFSSTLTTRKGAPPPKYQNGLFDWLKQQGFQVNDCSRCIKYTAEAPDVHKGHDIHCFIKDTFMKPYIPGTGIKGAIRTAVLYWKLKEAEDYYRDNYWYDLSGALKSGDKRKAGYAIQDMETEALRTIEYPNQKGRPNAVNDILKGLYVSDSTPIEPTFLQVLEKMDLSTYEKNRSNFRHLPIYREYLYPLTTTEFSITLDKSIVKGTVIKDVESILECVEYFSYSLVGEDGGLFRVFDVYRKDNPFFYPDDIDVPGANEYVAPNLCLGGGTGFLTKTIIHAIAPSPEEATDVIKKFLDKSFRQHQHFAKDKEISPRTLKLARSNDINLITGWCNIQQAM